ncbi:NAD(P)/FAD-dependent oxidoreductase [Paenibacillus daejeonensis]|uniref:NAD(P)/FAD-dependent oxidoreductase n=1 Tax=Paenibacillus daejeonensis TaxID=135193 RepID=UPI000370454B|nr:NAD(P)/FAD-dependent oxidoreductase [Paenibacillus daejeonensis]
MSEAHERYDVTIIGGGPAGMYAAFYAGMRDMKVKLIEGKDCLGGFLHQYREKMIWDVGGLPPMRCEQLIEWLSLQAQTFQPSLVFNRRVDGLERLGDGTLRLRTDNGDTHDTQTVIVAVGRGITEMTKLDIEGAERYELTNLHYTVQDLARFRGKRVLISGGGNSAVDWANELAEVAGELIVVHRRDQFHAMEGSIARMRKVADVRTPYQLHKLHGSGEAIHVVSVVHAESGAEERIAVDEVVVSHGYAKDYGDLLHWGMDIGHKGIRVSQQTETNLPGIFAAGDCADYDNKVSLIAGAFTDAVLAVNRAMRYINADAPGMAYVSSHNEKFRQLNRQLTQQHEDAPSRL